VTAVSRAIVLVDHGSRRPEANAQLDALAERVRAREPGTLVLTAHLEVARPDIAEALARCAEVGADDVVLLPWFLAPGRHTAEDIPRAVAAARARHPSLRVRIGEPIGLDATLVDLAMARVARAREGSASR
jgi:sirohydrochlorin ferrochelatase